MPKRTPGPLRKLPAIAIQLNHQFPFRSPPIRTHNFRGAETGHKAKNKEKDLHVDCKAIFGSGEL
jgi:hypothetical protein